MLYGDAFRRGLFQCRQKTGRRAPNLSRATSAFRGSLWATGVVLLAGLATAPAAQAGPDLCTVNGTIATCQGNQSAGIASGIDFTVPPVNTVNINNLTQNINIPPAGADAIAVAGGTLQPLTVNIDTGPFQIITTGGSDHAVFILTNGTESPVTFDIRATINVSGNDADGVRVQTSGTNSPIVGVNRGAITLSGDNADAIFARTLRSNSALTLTNWGVLSTTGTNSDGFNVETHGNTSPLMITNHAAITTSGDQSEGFETDTGAPNSPLTIHNHGPITTSGQFAEAIEGDTNFENSPIRVDNYATIMTTGPNSEGLDLRAVAANSSITIMNRGPINTTGDRAEGMEIETNGTNSPIVVTNWGPITTAGENADTIDLYINTNDAANTITLSNWANLTATGPIDADGISVAAPVLPNITVNLLGGIVQGGQGMAAGVSINGGNNNRLNISAGASVWALSGIAVDGTSGHDVINNYGTVTGNVLLGAGMNAFNNKTGGVFNSGMTVDLGAGNLLLNYGILSPGGTGSFQTTTQTMGNFRQDPGGTFLVDVDFAANQSDRFTVAAPGTASLAGSVKVNLVNPLNIQPLQQQMPVTIFTAASGVTNMGLTVVDTGVVDYTLIFPNATDVQLTALLNYAPAGLNLNQTALGLALNAIQTAGAGAPIAPLLGQLVLLPSLAALQGAYDTILPALYGNSLVTSLVAATLFADSLLSCREREGAHAIIAEGECLWFQAQGRFFDHDRTAQQIGFDETSGSFSAGGQVALGQYWRASAAVGYETSYVETSTAAEAETDRLHVGGALKYQRGAGLIAAAVSGGYGWVDSLRRVQALGFAAQPRGDTENHYVSGRLRGAWAFEGRHAYLKPLVDVAVTHVEQDGFTETGGGIANLVVGDIDETSISVSPALELGLEKQTRNGTLIRPFVRAGITAYDDDDVRVTAQFAAVTAGLAPFITTTGFDDVLVDISAGADLIGTDGATLKAFYDGQFGDDTEHHAAGLKGSIPLGRRALK